MHSKKDKWIVYVCQSKQSLQLGAGATLGAFVGLAPQNDVTICPAILSKTKGKGPSVRCIYQGKDDNGDASDGENEGAFKSSKSFEVNNVDSVEKVYVILTKYMNIKVSFLKWIFL